MEFEKLENRLKILEAERDNVEKVKKAIQVKLEDAEGFRVELLEKKSENFGIRNSS